MNRSPLLLLLVCAQVLMALACAVICLLLVSGNKKLGRQGTELSRFNMNAQAIKQLMDESIEYGKTHPAIDSTLVQMGLKQVAPAAAPASTTAPNRSASPKPNR